MNNLPTTYPAVANRVVSARRVAVAAAVVLSLVAAFLMTSCGVNQSALAPDDSPASADSNNPSAGAVGTSASTSESAMQSEPVNVIVGNAVLADLASRVGGDYVSVHNLIPPGSDAHSWQSSPRDSVRIAEAAVIVTNGAGLAGEVERLVENAASPDSVRVVASDGLEPQELLEMPFPDEDHEDDGEPVALHGRLLVGDGEGPGLSVIDLESGEVHQDAFDLSSRAEQIRATASGRYAVALSPGGNAAHLFDGGIYLEDHEGHMDMVDDDLSLLDVDLSGAIPAQLYTAGEWAAIFYHGSGDVRLLNEHELEEAGNTYSPVGFNVGAHQGATVPLDDDLFATTIQNPDTATNSAVRLPDGAEIRDLDGSVLYRAEGCPDLSGSAGNGHIAVFGCTGGALAIEAHDGEFESWFIPAMGGSPAEFQLTSVWGYGGLDHFFALGSSAGLYLIDPEAGEMEQLIPASDALRPIQAAVSHDGELLIVVMSNGDVQMYDAHDGDLLASASDLFSNGIDPENQVRPDVASAPGHIFITDSAGGQVIALDNHDLEVVERWEVAGKPTTIAFVGILGEGSNPEHGHAHTEGDPHFWQNPRLVVHYVNQIASGLIAADPDNASEYLDNAAEYIAELSALDAYIAETLAAVPEEHRVIVTFHDAFGYFATRYGMEVMAFVGSDAGGVSPDDIVRVLELVENRGLPAVFAEPQFAADALEQVARDANIEVGIIRSLPDVDYPDYIAMMRANADTLASLLR